MRRYAPPMFSPMVRWLLVFATLGFGIHALLAGQLHGVFFCASGVLLAIGHFLYGSVRAAFAALRAGNLKRAHKLHARTPTRFLTKESRAYYAWTAAALAEARGDLAEAKAELVKAIALPLRTKNDKTLALATLAAIHEKLGEKDLALSRIADVEALGPSDRLAPLLDALRAKLTD